MRIAAPVAVLAGTLLLAGCGEIGILRPGGPIAAGNRTILLNSLAVMLVIVIPTLVATVVFAWWFRASNKRAVYRPDFTYSGRIEFIVWSIPILTILFIGGLIYYGSHQLDPFRSLTSDKPALEVQVVSLDWKWLFVYPQAEVASVNELVIPAGTPIHFRLTSGSVMNTFFVPNLGSMIYTMNRMETQLHLQADEPGEFYGQSAHYSGSGFSDMNFKVRALPEAEFSRWATERRQDGPVLNAKAYAELARQSQDVKPFGYTHVQAGLFQAIVDQRLPPAPGPEQGRGGAEDVHPTPPPLPPGEHGAHDPQTEG